MNTADIFLLVIVIGAMLVGYFWGAARSLMLLAAWFLAFIIGAYVQITFGGWLAKQWTNFDAGFNQAAAFGIVYLGLLLLAPIVIVIGMPGDQRLSRSQVLDDVVGAVFAGFTVATWYPITPSSSLCETAIEYARRYRIDPETGQATFAIVQAEDELASIGMALGAGWAGARSMTATAWAVRGVVP